LREGKLRRLQEALEELYRVETALDISDFLLDEEGLSGLGAEAAGMAERGEVLFVTEAEGEVSLGLYLREDLRQTLDDGAPSPRYFATLEGVSHFVYLAYHASHDRPVKKLELELQAEVDKFAAGVLGVAPRGPAQDPTDLRRWLFEELALDPSLDPEEEERYRTASRLARHYSVFLERRYLRERRTARLVDELRRFYRLALGEKIGHILGT
jgi:hypothetical protein